MIFWEICTKFKGHEDKPSKFFLEQKWPEKRRRNLLKSFFLSLEKVNRVEKKKKKKKEELVVAPPAIGQKGILSFFLVLSSPSRWKGRKEARLEEVLSFNRVLGKKTILPSLKSFPSKCLIFSVSTELVHWLTYYLYTELITVWLMKTNIDCTF